jgi:sigma-E factor negative regulatory protein RseA
MMLQEAVKDPELVSALADGQLSGEEFALAVAWVGAAQDARLSWHAYHVVGDVLRCGESMAGAHDAAFLRRLRLGLAQEATLMQKVPATASAVEHKISLSGAGLGWAKGAAANDNRWRWKLVSGVASVVAVLVLSWQFLTGSDGQFGASQRVQAPELSGNPVAALQQTPVATNVESQVMLRDPQLDALLAAHRQFGGTSALQMPAGFLRNATFEGVTR